MWSRLLLVLWALRVKSTGVTSWWGAAAGQMNLCLKTFPCVSLKFRVQTFLWSLISSWKYVSSTFIICDYASCLLSRVFSPGAKKPSAENIGPNKSQENKWACLPWNKSMFRHLYKPSSKQQTAPCFHKPSIEPCRLEVYRCLDERQPNLNIYPEASAVDKTRSRWLSWYCICEIAGQTGRKHTAALCSVLWKRVVMPSSAHRECLRCKAGLTAEVFTLNRLL